MQGKKRPSKITRLNGGCVDTYFEVIFDERWARAQVDLLK